MRVSVLLWHEMEDVFIGKLKLYNLTEVLHCCIRQKHELCLKIQNVVFIRSTM